MRMPYKAWTKYRSHVGFSRSFGSGLSASCESRFSFGARMAADSRLSDYRIWHIDARRIANYWTGDRMERITKEIRKRISGVGHVFFRNGKICCIAKGIERELFYVADNEESVGKDLSYLSDIMVTPWVS